VAELSREEPLASIVIPVFNGMPYLREALSSALEQDYVNLEVVVIENGSDDGTRQWLEAQVDGRLRVVYRENTQPADANWTEAILESRGDYVKLMCADDLIEPSTVSAQVRALRHEPRAVLTASRRRIIDAEGRVLKKSHGLDGLHGFVPGDQAVRACMLAGTNLLGEPAAVLFRGDQIRNAMPWRPDLPYVIDLATYAELLANGALVGIREVLASFRVTASSWSASLVDEQPRQFRAWRGECKETMSLPFTRVDMVRSEVSLHLRTLARRWFFRRAQ
jgi:glycosyltransferase involved in cell wall biosynthesis